MAATLCSTMLPLRGNTRQPCCAPPGHKKCLKVSGTIFGSGTKNLCPPQMVRAWQNKSTFGKHARHTVSSFCRYISINTFTPKTDQFQISPAASPCSNIISHSMKNLAFQMKGAYTTNSHYITYTFLFKRLGECNFLILGMTGLNAKAFLKGFSKKSLARVRKFVLGKFPPVFKKRVILLSCCTPDLAKSRGF